MHAIAHWGCTDTVREPALKVDTRRKKNTHTKTCRTREGLEPVSVLSLAFQSDALPTELFPAVVIMITAVIMIIIM